MKTLKKLIVRPTVLIVLIALASVLLYAASGQVTLSLSSGNAVTKASKAFVKGQVDTVRLGRDAGLSALAFGIHRKDSSILTSVIVRRVVDGVAMAVIAGDTLITADTIVAAKAQTKAVTMAPLADEYWFIVTYDTTTARFGVTTPTAVYEAIRQY